jgi:drug/metabolite transporter superfamily protein YnfA
MAKKSGQEVMPRSHQVILTIILALLSFASIKTQRFFSTYGFVYVDVTVQVEVQVEGTQALAGAVIVEAAQEAVLVTMSVIVE